MRTFLCMLAEINKTKLAAVPILRLSPVFLVENLKSNILSEIPQSSWLAKKISISFNSHILT